jgi:hypothetical protein
MRSIGSLAVGWVDTSIAAVVADGLLSRFHSVLITSIDSTTDISASIIGERIVTSDARCSFLGTGIVVPGKILARSAEVLNLFNGFDELWCYEQAPAIPKPRDLLIVYPRNFETEEVPSGLLSWVEETDCKLALGDGVGLNFVTPSEEIANSIRHFAGGGV